MANEDEKVNDVNANTKYSVPDGEDANRLSRKAYWESNLRLVTVLLIIWAVVSFGCSILFADALNQIRIGGFRLGFWFAQQGSIFVFVILIFVYVICMNRLDEKYDVDEV